MKKLFSCLIALSCITGLTPPAMADALVPHIGAGGIGLTLLLGIACIAAAIIIAINRRNKK